MKVALCFSGHMRTYQKTEQYWKQFIIDPLKADVFIHTWKRKGPWVGSFGKKSDVYDPGTIRMEDDFVDQDHVVSTFQPKRIVFEDYFDKEPEFVEIAKPAVEWKDQCPPLYHGYKVTSYISQFYKWFKSNELKNAYEMENDFSYDLVIRTRPDLRISAPLPREVFLDQTKVYVKIRQDLNNPVWVNDQMIIANSRNMDTITKIYPQYSVKFEQAKMQNIPHLFFEIHTILWNHIQQNELQLQEVNLPFSLVR